MLNDYDLETQIYELIDNHIEFSEEAQDYIYSMLPEKERMEVDQQRRQELQNKTTKEIA